MTYAVTIYVDADGAQYGAGKTDQRHTSASDRTVNGRPVVSAGTWYACQMSYRPFRAAVAAAQCRAASLTDKG
jgi:hypothetical protein